MWLGERWRMVRGWLAAQRGPYEKMIPFVAPGAQVPRIVHQTFSAIEMLPPEIRDLHKRMKGDNPGWQFRFYDNAEVVAYIRRHYGMRVLGYYKRIDRRYGAARADLFRYLCLYREGGIYLDVKSFATRPLDSLVRAGDRFLIAQWGPEFPNWGRYEALHHVPGGEFQQWHIVAAPGHPFLRAVILRVLRNIDAYAPDRHGTGRPAVLAITGPIAYTEAIHPLLSQHCHRRIDASAEGLHYSLYPRGTPGGPGALYRPSGQQHYRRLKHPLIKPPVVKPPPQP
jgi:inositol phosphorylceramide mannosyltransferase catalytic subunit